MKMNTDLLRSAVAAIFRRKGKKYLTEEEFIFAASMELRWFPPARAASLLKNAKIYGMVSSTLEGLTPTFSIEDKNLSQVISPPADAAEEVVDLVATVLDLVSAVAKQPKSEVMARINRLKKELNIETQTSAILVAAQSGLDVEALAQGGLDELIRNYSK